MSQTQHCCRMLFGTKQEQCFIKICCSRVQLLCNSDKCFTSIQFITKSKHIKLWHSTYFCIFNSWVIYILYRYFYLNIYQFLILFSGTMRTLDWYNISGSSENNTVPTQIIGCKKSDKRPMKKIL